MLLPQGDIMFTRRAHVAAALLMVALSASSMVGAHHSPAMYDLRKTRTLIGTVRVFHWTNPHCAIQLAVNERGRTVVWNIELGSVNGLNDIGWRRSTIRAGQLLTVTVHPEYDGSASGLFVSALQENGSPLRPVSRPPIR